MKNRLLVFIILCVVASAPNVWCSRAPDVKRATEPKAVAATAESSVGVPLDGNVQKTRSVAVATDSKITFNATAFAGNNQFYLGGDATAADENFALSRASLKRVDGVWADELKPLAPGDGAGGGGVTVNNVGATADSPFYGKKVAIVTVGADIDNNLRPVVAVVGDPSHVYLVSNIADGTAVLRNAAEDNTDNDHLTDLGGKSAATGFFALAATQQEIAITDKTTANLIFAAVGDDPEKFNTANSCIAAVKVNEKKLSNLKKNVGVNFTAATGADGTAGFGPLGIKGTATLADTATVDMFWDDQLQKLFIGFTELKTPSVAITGGGGAVALAVGGWDSAAQKIKATSVIGSDAANGAANKPAPGGAALALTMNDPAYIIGASSNATLTGGKNQQIDIHKVRTMHTSTGKDYVIVNGGAGDVNAGGIEDVKTKVYALPVMPSGDANTGRLAQDPQVTDAKEEYALPTNENQLVRADKEWAIVGVDPAYISADQKQSLSDMHVMGDFVYVSVNGDQTTPAERGADHKFEAGIFSSRAIFDTVGNIAKWTPWQRERGMTDVAFGFGVDPKTNMTWYLSTEDGNVGDPVAAATTAKTTIWNAGDDAAADDGGVHNGAPLSSALTSETFGHINGLFTFDGETAGFKVPTNKYDALDVMVATGKGNVALIESGRLAARETANVFETTQKFVTGADNQPVYIQTNSDLQALGNIVTAEFSRKAAAGNGWLFVGGNGGVAVLAKTADGTGFDGATGLAQLKGANADDYPGGTDWGWKQLTPPAGASFNNVRKIVADGTAGFVYVLTRTALYRFTSQATDFVDGVLTTGPAAGYFKTIIDISKEQLGTDTKAGGIKIGKNDAGVYPATVAATVLTLDKNFDELYDFMLVKSDETGIGLTTVILATSRGLVVSNAFSDNLTTTKPFFKVPVSATGDDFVVGPALRFDFVNSMRGGQMANAVTDVYTAEGNLYATAVDKAVSAVNVYRFAVSDGAVKAIREPYIVDENQIEYFYQISTIPAEMQPYLAFNGPLDFVGTSEKFGHNNNDFTSAVPMVPQPDKFLGTDPITLGGSGLDLGGVVVTDSASGAKYIPGEFGVIVNE